VSCSAGCVTVKWLLALLYFVAAAAALVGVYETHIVTSSDGARTLLQFGSTSGSLAIIAFCIAATLWKKQMAGCMGKCEICSSK